HSMGAHTAPFFFKGGKTGVLLIHGFTGTPWSMRELGLHLSSAGFTVMAPLLPGHGTIPPDLIGIRWEQWVESLMHARDRLAGQCDSIFAAGLSMGGALAYALAARSRLEGVISMAAPFRLERPGIRLLPLVLPFKRYWKKKKGAHLSDEGLQIAYDRYPLAGVMEFQKLLADMRPRLSEVTCPALILHAKGDPTVSFENAARIEAALGSGDKRRILLDDPCHIITHGADRHRLETEVLGFIRRVSKNKGRKEKAAFAFRGL
ncbi:alpha/beta fold hydrolase, partial [bacterium]|nr:alpha/beta fold hydrolase [bacterium]